MATGDSDVPWWLKELRQYGVAALVMGICMAALYLLYVDTKEERRAKDSQTYQLAQQVTEVVKDNTRAIEQHSEAIEKLNDKLSQ